MGELLDSIAIHDIPKKTGVFIVEIRGNEVIVIIDGKRKTITLDKLIKLDKENKIILDVMSREKLNKALHQRQINRALQADSIINNSKSDRGFELG